MKKLFYVFLAAMIFAAPVYAQRKVAVDTNKYMRNSICLMLLDESNYEKSEIITQSFNLLPVPDKYNDHNLPERVFKIADLQLTEEDMNALDSVTVGDILPQEEEEGEGKKKKGGFGKFMGGLAKGVASAGTGGLVGGGADRSAYAAIANKLIVDNNMAKQMVDKWFLDSTGKFSEVLVYERGLYNYTAEDIALAKETIMGVENMAKDSGYELLNSTFLIANHFNYLPKDSVIAEMTATAATAGALVGALGGIDLSGAAVLAGGTAAVAMGEGYFVKITSYLFKLKWNEDIENIFFNDLWNNPEAYAASDMFTCEYIGSEKAFANVKSSIFKGRPEEELIHMATVNAVDAVLAKLEKKYDVFKTKTPLLINQGADGKYIYTAKIGLKEGLEAGDKYEVLEQVYNQEIGRIEYKKAGELKVSKKQIWDNRFGADEESRAKGEAVQEFEETLFEGNIRNPQMGMFLRQIK